MSLKTQFTPEVTWSFICKGTHCQIMRENEDEKMI